VRLQHPRRLVSARPPHKASLRQPLLRQPESLSVIHQDADRCPSPAAKHKQAAGERIGLQFLLTQLCQRVDALSSVHGFDRHQNAHLGSDLDHVRSHNARLNPGRSGVVVPFHCTRILPCTKAKPILGNGRIRAHIRACPPQEIFHAQATHCSGQYSLLSVRWLTDCGAKAQRDGRVDVILPLTLSAKPWRSFQISAILFSAKTSHAQATRCSRQYS
jgi:hypothetical protein